MRKGFDTNQTDFRYNWPAQIFTHVCKCTGNWAGYDCSRCKRGYGGADCTVKLDPVVRRNFLDLSSSEKDRIIEILNMSKYMESDFTVPIDENLASTDSFKVLSLFDVFATFHYYTIRDEALKGKEKEEFMIPDFAHEGPGFLPWHRAYLLYFETELQYMLNDHTFALPYWDWTAYSTLKTANNDECPDIFSFDLFGHDDDCKNKNISEAGTSIISKNFKWTPVCVSYAKLVNPETRELCNPYENDKMNESECFIKRCIGSTRGDPQCRAGGTLPTEADVEIVNNELQYDVCGYDKDKETEGFRNALEGYYNFNNVIIDKTCPGFAEMHNKVHLYIGGLMKDVPTSSNDPIFWLHHCNVDRLYEKWLANPEADISYKPAPIDNSVEYIIGFGHNGNDNAGLLFPPITNVEAHKQASEFGYSYQDPISCTTDATSTTSSTPSTPENTPTSSSSSSMVSTTSNPDGTTSNPGGTTSHPGGTTSNPSGTSGTNPGGNPTSGGVRSSLYQNHLVNLCSYITK